MARQNRKSCIPSCTNLLTKMIMRTVTADVWAAIALMMAAAMIVGCSSDNDEDDQKAISVIVIR